jgi:ADP-heptose:LPS heptosyltransferase
VPGSSAASLPRGAASRSTRRCTCPTRTSGTRPTGTCACSSTSACRSAPDRALEWTVTADDERELRALDLEPGAYVVLHPGATSASRRWPLDRFAEVAHALDEEGLRVVVGGVPSEAQTTGALVAAAALPRRST